jgi:transposase-like protein
MGVRRHDKTGKKRRHFTTQFKFGTVMDGLRGEKSATQICRKRDITLAIRVEDRTVLTKHRQRRGQVESR